MSEFDGMARAVAAAEPAERYFARMALDGDAEADEARDLVRPDQLVHAPYRLLVEAAFALRAAGGPVDAGTVYAHLVRAGRLADLGGGPAAGKAFLAEFWGERVTGAGLAGAAADVRAFALQRALYHLGDEMARDALGRLDDPAAAAEAFARRLDRLVADQPGARDPVPVAAALRRAVGRYAAAGDAPRAAAGVTTGFPSLDAVLGGFRPGDLVVLAARPSVGKSALALRAAEGVARAGAPVLVVSLEMGTDENVDRMVSGAARVPLRALRGDARLTDADAARVLAQAGPGGLGGLPIYLDDAADRTAAAVAAVARRAARRWGVKLVVVDYLQLLRPDDPRAPRYLQVGEATKALKRVARAAGVAVLCLAQLNREVEARADKRPQLSDLRDSGEIEQDADAVLLLHRHDAGDHARHHHVDLIVEKNRNGPRATVALEYDRPFVRFDERGPAPDPEPAARGPRSWLG